MSHLRRISTVRWGWAVVGAAWSAFQGIDFSINKWCSTEHKNLWNTNTLHIPFSWHTWIIGILALLVLFILEGSYQQSQRLKAEIDGLDPSSPRLSVSVEEIDVKGLPSTGVVLTNLGNSAIYKLHIDDMMAAGYTVRFDSNIPILDAHKFTHPIKLNIRGLGALQTFYLPSAMMKDWDAQGERAGKAFLEKLLFPCTATYEDGNGNAFCASWEFEFYPFKFRRHEEQSRRILLSARPTTPPDPYVVVSSVRTERLSKSVPEA